MTTIELINNIADEFSNEKTRPFLIQKLKDLQRTSVKEKYAKAYKIRKLIDELLTNN